MNPIDPTPPAPGEMFTVEELESRFEMETLAAPGIGPVTDWSCTCTITV